MPESFFVLSKEHLDLAIDEVIAIAKSYDRFSKIQTISNLVIISSKTSWDKIARRATFVKIAGQILKKLSNLLLDKKSFSILLNAEFFACKVVNLTSTKSDFASVESTMGNIISKFSKARVSLKNPDIIIYLILTDESSFFGYSTKYKKLARPKKVKKHPHELDWKLSRAMVNLSGLKEGDTICDPFCGTGSTLLEAESMGIHSIGIDFDKKMCKICKENLAANGYNSRIINADYSHLKKLVGKFDGLVTDVPYGLASKVSDIPEQMLQNFISIIPKRKKLVLMCKKSLEKEVNLKINKRYEIYRHKSLIRIILVK